MSRGKRTGTAVEIGRAGHDVTPARLAEPPTPRPRFRSHAGMRDPVGCWHRSRFLRALAAHRREQDKLERRLQVGPGSKRGW